MLDYIKKKDQISTGSFFFKIFSIALEETIQRQNQEEEKKKGKKLVQFMNQEQDGGASNEIVIFIDEIKEFVSERY